MKKLLILFLFIWSVSPAQMIRQTLTYKGVNYLRYDPPKGTVVQGAILYLHGIGERGNTVADLSLIERNDIPKQMASITVPYIVIAPQLPTALGGWYENITNPMVELINSLPGHHHITALSLGAMRVTIVLMENPGVFQSASTVCGKNDVADVASITKVLTELDKIPSIHYYDPLDQTIANGYGSIKTLTDQLIQSKADCTLQLINMSGSDHHSIWPIAYQQANFWQWLNSKVTPPATLPLDPVVKTEYDSTNNNIIYTTQSGKKIVVRALTSGSIKLPNGYFESLFNSSSFLHGDIDSMILSKMCAGL